MVTASIMGTATTAAGLIAASIAVGGFVLHLLPALSGAPDDDLRRATVIGGACGLGVSLFVIFLSAVMD
jgi:hypothetical protein